MESPENLNLNQNALTVLSRRYLLKDSQGKVAESPTELFSRVADFIAKADLNYGATETQVKDRAAEFFQAITRLEFLPNSPTLMNAGRELGQLSACFVLPVGDSMEEIFEAVKQSALIHKSGGGTGFSFSRLRPRNSIVASTSGIASGPVSFMKVFNSSTEAVKQGGTRRGANMGILRVDHPDILEFIRCKSDTSEITNFNISIAVTDQFMTALESGEEYPLIDPRSGEIHVVDGREIKLKARDIFDLIVEHAWATGEPGIVFIDRMNRLNPTYPAEPIEATNPCGEQPLPPFDSCNLGSINLGKFVIEIPHDQIPDKTPEEGLDWSRLGSAVRTAVHFLDNVIDMNRYPLPQIEAQSKKNRRIGLGLMGLADLFVKLRLPYNSPAALLLAERIISFIEEEAKKHSSHLAKTRGKFPGWDDSIFAGENVAMRNATVTTIAPTGTISIIAGCSSGIEPYYAIAFERNVLDGTRLVEVNPLFEQIARQRGFYSIELIDKIAGQRSLAEIDEIPSDIKEIFLTAADITPEDHVAMQAVFQGHVDSSVSKTINFPQSATREDVARAFEQAYKSGCKGVTIYRDNSRPSQVLSVKTAPVKTQKVQKRPAQLEGFTEKVRTGYGNLYVTVNSHMGKPFEVFAQIGKSGFSTMADSEAICRLISLSLRSGVDIGEVIRQLQGIGGSSQVFSGGGKVRSIPDAIAQVLNRRFGSPEDSAKSPDSEICPDCGLTMVFVSGCFCCQSCGYSNC